MPPQETYELASTALYAELCKNPGKPSTPEAYLLGAIRDAAYAALVTAERNTERANALIGAATCG
jgi:hypothetical protein